MVSFMMGNVLLGEALFVKEPCKLFRVVMFECSAEWAQFVLGFVAVMGSAQSFLDVRFVV